MELELIKENNKGKTYQGENFKLLYRNKDTISGDNSENVEEKIYLLTGEAEITSNSVSKTIKAPKYFEFPAKTYHKIKAITNITLILFEN